MKFFSWCVETRRRYFLALLSPVVIFVIIMFVQMIPNYSLADTLYVTAFFGAISMGLLLPGYFFTRPDKQEKPTTVVFDNIEGV
jgi:hypothetical protein